MNRVRDKLLVRMKSIGIDTDGAIKRLCNNVELYEKILVKFLEDGSYKGLKDSLDNNNFKDAQMYSHTLKGLGGNLGFIELATCSTKILELLRGGELDNLDYFMGKLSEEYIKVTSLIKELKNNKEV
ncbi:Hpt domain-containing protein [Clostridium paraputrificum]|uniref:Hpt domain-containing protein n=1 Tax=Clostridium paraputrificum TaxID=29363 RepID=UPI003D33E308